MYEQTDRPIKLTTPLGANALLLVELQGREAISATISFRAEDCLERQDQVAAVRPVAGQESYRGDLSQRIQAILQRHRLPSEPGRSGRELHVLQPRGGAGTLAAGS